MTRHAPADLDEELEPAPGFDSRRRLCALESELATLRKQLARSAEAGRRQLAAREERIVALEVEVAKLKASRCIPVADDDELLPLGVAGKGLGLSWDSVFRLGMAGALDLRDVRRHGASRAVWRVTRASRDRFRAAARADAADAAEPQPSKSGHDPPAPGES